MDALKNLRPRASGILLVLGVFYMFTSADQTVRGWWWVPAGGLCLWALTLIFEQYQGSILGERVVQLAERLTDAVVALVVVTALIVLAPYVLKLDPKLLLTSFLGLLTAAFVVLLFLYIREGEAVELRSHWGGLGGSVAGWRISMPLVCLIAAFTFGSLDTIVNVRTPASTPPTVSDGSQKLSDQKTAESKTLEQRPVEKSAAPPQGSNTAPAQSATAPNPAGNPAKGQSGAPQGGTSSSGGAKPQEGRGQQ